MTDRPAPSPLKVVKIISRAYTMEVPEDVADLINAWQDNYAAHRALIEELTKTLESDHDTMMGYVVNNPGNCGARDPKCKTCQLILRSRAVLGER